MPNATQSLSLSSSPSTAPSSVHRAEPASGRASRVLVFAYGVACYFVGVSGIVALILASFGVIPFSGRFLALEGTAAKILFNLGLIAVFGIQHAIMARESFKKRWRQVLPEAAERVTFTALAGGLSLAIVFLWQPLPTLLWSADAPLLRAALYTLGALGWAYLFAATFAIDHFELFGLKQIWCNLRGTTMTSPAMAERFMYRFDRHPIMTGSLLGFWSLPTMRLDSFLLALFMTIFVVLGVAIEERDLLRKHGASYRDYMQRVRSVVPSFHRG